MIICTLLTLLMFGLVWYLRQMISGYLRQQITQGRVRQLDPELAAQALLGMLLAYSISLSLLPEAMAHKPLKEVASQFVDLFVEGTRFPGD